MALHHEKLFLNVMCHSGDLSKQDDGGAARIGPSFPFRVDAVEKCPPVVGFVIGEAFLAYSWLGVAA
jgi:hypothetical protein